MGQSLEVQVRDSHLTGRSVLGRVRVPLTRLPSDSTLDAWLPVEGPDGGRAGEIHLQITYKVPASPFDRKVPTKCFRCLLICWK